MKRLARIFLLAMMLTLPVRAGSADWRPIRFTSVYGDEVAAEATSILTHERHGVSGSHEISLPAIRFRSTAASPGTPIVYLAGGPGESGLNRARQEIFAVLMRLRSYADVIVFDQRGTGTASPSLLLEGNYDLPQDRPLHDAAVRARLAQIASVGAAEMRRRGVDLSAYNTEQSAEDIEDLRQALGVERIAIWGHSYGSHLGLAYLRAHPDHVSAAILGGINDLGNRWRLPSDGDALLARIDAAIRADPRMAERIPDFLGLVRNVMTDLDRRPRQVPSAHGTIYVGREELQVLIALNSGNIFFIRELPALFVRMAHGDFARVAELIQQFRSAPLGTAMRHGMHIASGVSLARLAQIAAEAPGAISGDGINFPYNLPQFVDPWHVADLGESFRSPPPSNVPVLFMNGEFDGRTSTREARETAARFSHSAFSEVTGVAHDFYNFTPQISEAMLAFLRDHSSPPARINGLAMEFRSPDEPEIVQAFRQDYQRGGVDAAIALMTTMAGATTGPLFNVSTARHLAGLIAEAAPARPLETIRFLQAADGLFPNDFLIARQMATLYRNVGDRSHAIEKLELLLRIDAVAGGVEHELALLHG